MAANLKSEVHDWYARRGFLAAASQIEYIAGFGSLPMIRNLQLKLDLPRPIIRVEPVRLSPRDNGPRLYKSPRARFA